MSSALWSSLEDNAREALTAVGAVSNTIGSALRAKCHREPNLAVAARCGSALRQHCSRPVGEHDGSIRRPLHA